MFAAEYFTFYYHFIEKKNGKKYQEKKTHLVKAYNSIIGFQSISQ